MAQDHEVDVLIVGAGPVGLFAVYYSGFRGLSVAVVDSLPEIGGRFIASGHPYDTLPLPALLGVEGKEFFLGAVCQQAAAGHLLPLMCAALSLVLTSRDTI